MKFISIFPLWTVALLTFACVQEVETELNQPCTSSCFEIQGRFTTEDGTVGIADLPVKLRWGVYGMFNGTNRTIATSETNENGFYSFSFTPRQEELAKGSFSVTFDPPSEFHSGENYFELFNINQSDTTVIRNYHIPLKARLKIVITNPEAITGADYLHCNVRYQFDALENKNFIVSGAIDTRFSTQYEFSFDAAGNQYTYVEILKKRKEVFEAMQDSVMVVPDQELLYELRF